MILLNREDTFKNCDSAGEIQTRAALEAGHFPGNEAFVREWLLLKEEEHRKQREADTLNRADRAVDAAERSARASEKAAQFALWSATISLATVAVAVIKGCAD